MQDSVSENVVDDGSVAAPDDTEPAARSPRNLAAEPAEVRSSSKRSSGSKRGSSKGSSKRSSSKRLSSKEDLTWKALDMTQVPHEKKYAVMQLLNPLLEEMVAECVVKMPPDPSLFMLFWLERKLAKDANSRLSEDEKAALKSEHKELKEKLSKAKIELQEEALMVANFVYHEGEDENSDEEDDASVSAVHMDGDSDDLPADFRASASQLSLRRGAVSIEEVYEVEALLPPPAYPKTDAQRALLRGCLLDSFIFSNWEAKDLDLVIAAMHSVQVEPRSRVSIMGEAGEFLLVVESGTLNCTVRTSNVVCAPKAPSRSSRSSGSYRPSGGSLPVAAPKELHLRLCKAGDMFGELALLHSSPRAASIQSTEPCRIWQLDRGTFRYICENVARKKFFRHMTLLRRVPLFDGMSDEERSKVAEALRVEFVPDGHVIVQEGDVGSRLYIVEEGRAFATRHNQVVASYCSGDYFGEVALLLRRQRRLETVIANGAMRLLSLSQAALHRLVYLEDILERAGAAAGQKKAHRVK
eukprot:gnl/TRDRNA2_/TRDRNA2_44476_c0_seq1.p1 gnl/TRDRNA2_/TRDRNA2_44476_c0~~gnl/TRDRNA2_/TRDRNA2_44476_c0_seq1.p1  ORF type:complete len:526 (+),score=114.32 gnl/TRDRNA2_/TRDRNA2_44476_c0_seq1:65-1642(+)